MVAKPFDAIIQGDQENNRNHPECDADHSLKVNYLYSSLSQGLLTQKN